MGGSRCEAVNHKCRNEKTRRLRLNLLVLDEGVLVDGLDDVFEEDLGGESVTMVDYGLAILTVPAVHCGSERRRREGVSSRKQRERVCGRVLQDTSEPLDFVLTSILRQEQAGSGW